jgi:hypothetical protein
MIVTVPGDAVPPLLLQAAEDVLGAGRGPLRVIPLPGDGSERRFYRILDGRRRAIGLSSPRVTTKAVDENDSFLLIGRHLHGCGLPVPEFIWADASQGLFLLEDFGDVHLQLLVNRRRRSLASVYGQVIRLLLRLHERAPGGFLPEYCHDAPVYDASFVLEREIEYFRKAFLEAFLETDWDKDPNLRMEIERLAESAGASRREHVIHRDFQSRNLMVLRGRMGLLDFQGMRFGPPAYDLASLLIDPYVNLPEPVQAGLKELYWRGARCFLGLSRQAFDRSYAAARLCRNLQVLAAYAFLGLARGKPRFLAYIPLAWSRLRWSLRWAGPDNYPNLTRRLGEERLQSRLDERLRVVLRDKGC